MSSNWPAMERRGPPAGEPDVLDFEQRTGHSLPPDYRAFVKAVNGGRLASSHCESPNCVVNRLFSLLDPDEGRNLELRTQRASDLPSRDLLFIGHDDTGGRILLALAGDHRGEVWLQLHDERPSGSNPRAEPFRRRDMLKLANSFAEFMSSLGPLKP